MLPTSHFVPIQARPPVSSGSEEALLLADAFSDFIAASARLEQSYRELQVEVGQLGLELAARNRELEASLERNEQMRRVLATVVDSMPCGVVVLGAAEKVLRINPEARRILSLGSSPIGGARDRGGEGRSDRKSVTESAEGKAEGKATERDSERDSGSGAESDSESDLDCDADSAGGALDSLAAVSARVSTDLGTLCGLEGEHEFSFIPGAGVGVGADVGADLGGVAGGVMDGCGAGRRWVELRTRRLADPASDVQRVLILNDVSAHKQAEFDREAGRRGVALAEIAATLAHEVRNPLASLELFTGLLEEAPERGVEWVGHLRAGLRRLAATVNNVLSFHGAGFLPLRPLVLAEVLWSAAEFARPMTEQGGLTLAFDCEDAVARVQANEAALQQLVLNLVVNAVRHTEAGGCVRISLMPGAARRLVLAVADTGSGIRAAELERIFEPGWSATGNTTGLGLAVCRRIAAQHGSLLRAASTVGRGSVFTMELETL